MRIVEREADLFASDGLVEEVIKKGVFSVSPKDKTPRNGPLPQFQQHFVGRVFRIIVDRQSGKRYLAEDAYFNPILGKTADLPRFFSHASAKKGRRR